MPRQEKITAISAHNASVTSLGEAIGGVSFSFRPTHDAVLEAQSYVQSGRRIVVDVDLEKFFDRVNHDILIDR
ncbi:hypothetical protein GOA56_32725, partial [Sinorhizobium meliloti]|nr:hypothetical protein [Sinorhizobium meliloti]MDW9832176.1 hypothetical protein [Sinorhizobium meliloti]